MNIQAQSCNLCGKISNKGALSGTIKSEDSLRGKMCKPDLLVVHEVSFNVDDTFSNFQPLFLLLILLYNQ